MNVWDVTQNKTLPDDLKSGLNNVETLTVWHNGGMFDTVILKQALAIYLPLLRVHDTLALAHDLPGALGLLCEIFNIRADKAKDKEGKALIQLFCKPRPKNSKIRRATTLTHVEEWKRFKRYANQAGKDKKDIHMTSLREAKIEKHLVNEMRKIGGIAYKFVSPGRRGVPNRLVILPEGRIIFVECKAPGETPTPYQLREHARLFTLGHQVIILASHDLSSILSPCELYS